MTDIDLDLDADGLDLDLGGDATDVSDVEDLVSDLVDDLDLDLDLGTDAPDDGGILDLDLGGILGSDDGLFGSTAFSASATSGTVDSLAFAQASDDGVVSYTLDAGTYLVTQTVTPDGCSFTGQFTTVIVAGETVTESVELTCEVGGTDDSGDGDDGGSDDGGNGGGDSSGDDGNDGGKAVTNLPSTGNGSDTGVMTDQTLVILISLVSALAVATAFGWNLRSRCESR